MKGTSACPLEVLLGKIPIEQLVDDRFEEIRPPVLVIEIIGMLPNVDGKQTVLAFRHRRNRVRRLLDGELAA